MEQPLIINKKLVFGDVIDIMGFQFIKANPDNSLGRLMQV